jgi:hypothetical protein
MFPLVTILIKLIANFMHLIALEMEYYSKIPSLQVFSLPCDQVKIICPCKIYWYQEKFVLNYDFVGKFTTRAPKIEELQVSLILSISIVANE